MRELKFRVWSITYKCMYDRVLAGPGDPCSCVYDESRGEWVNFDDACGTIMQFTGLKDKHGKEVYEGDIVRHQDISWGTYIEVVKYEQGLWNYSSGIVSGSRCQKPHIHWEVIGNVYENPELLEMA